jgi:hypothetical protein
MSISAMPIGALLNALSNCAWWSSCAPRTRTDLAPDAISYLRG